MTVHLVKLAVGAKSIADLEAWVKKRTAMNVASGFGRVHDHVTRMFPKRAEDLTSGGSIFWVIDGNIRVRQQIKQLETVTGADGINRCAIILKPKLIAVTPTPKKAFQGWRYLSVADAPPDLDGVSSPAEAELYSELSSLGLM
ncbi:MAG: DUF1489 domain-containing protein [Pseudomonadota bacterium]